MPQLDAEKRKTRLFPMQDLRGRKPWWPGTCAVCRTDPSSRQFRFRCTGVCICTERPLILLKMKSLMNFFKDFFYNSKHYGWRKAMDVQIRNGQIELLEVFGIIWINQDWHIQGCRTRRGGDKIKAHIFDKVTGTLDPNFRILRKVRAFDQVGEAKVSMEYITCAKK